MQNNHLKLFILGGSTIAILIIFALMSPFTVIGSGSRGIIVSLGEVQDEVLDEGFHWVGVTDSVKEVTVQTQRFEAVAGAASADLQSVSATIVLNAHLDPFSVNKLYQEIGLDYESKIIAPAIQESVKGATAQFTAEELITKRNEVSQLMQEALTERLSKYYILVESVSIVDFQFSPAFNEAVEAKVTAEQNALAEKNKLEQVKYETEQRIVQATGEAEAIRIQAEAITSQGGSEYVQLQWIEKWNGSLPTTMLNDAASVLLGL